jgi:hypothetical protein
MGATFGWFFLAIGIAGLLVTLLIWAALTTGSPSCVSSCSVELDPNNSVLIITGMVVSMVLFALGALFVLISNLLRPPKVEKPVQDR